MQIKLPAPLLHQCGPLDSPERFKILACGRRWGKTVAGLVSTVDGHGGPSKPLKGALQGGNIWWVAPTYGIASKIWRMLKASCREAWTEKNEVERRIILPDIGMGDGTIQVMSGDNPDSLRGDGLDGVVIDEAAFLAKEVWTNALRPALADKQGWALLISSPNGLNWFYEMHRSLPDSAKWQRPTSDNPRIPASEIEAAKAELPYLAFRQEFLAEFVTDGAGVFMRDWFQFYVNAPLHFDRIIQCWDTAFKDKETSDRSACLTIGVNSEGIYILDCYAGRLQFPDLKDMAMALYSAWRPSVIVVEDKASGQSLVQELRRIQTPTGAPLPIHEFKVDRNKRARANAVSPIVRAGRVYLPQGRSWVSDFLHELITFTGVVDGEQDDIVDSFSMGLTYLYWQPAKPTSSQIVMSPLALGKDTERPVSEQRHQVSVEYGDAFDWGGF